MEHPDNEYSFLFSAGRTSTNLYKEESGKHFFLPYNNSSRDYRLKYTMFLNKEAKVSTGIILGSTEFEFFQEFDEKSLPGISDYF